MDLAWRYAVLVQVVLRNGHDAFYGYVPDFGIETYEILDPGNLSQEYMFHLKLRRLIGEALSVCRAEKKEVPLIRSIGLLKDQDLPQSEDRGSYSSSTLVSTSVAAQMLGVHPDTIRSLFDSGSLKGSLTKGRQRLILVSSIHEEEARMLQRAELRKLEPKKSFRRRQKRIQKQKKEKLALFNSLTQPASSENE